jgi:predicted RNA-binding Zn ribbon-like protein
MVTPMSEMHGTPPEPASEGELFLDFANTVELTDGQPHDHVPDGPALHAWLLARGLASGRVSASAVEAQLPSFRALRDLVREITARLATGDRPTASQLRRLNRVLRDGVHHHELAWDATGGRFRVGQVGSELEQARAAIAGSLAHYVADHDVHRLRVCANDGCRWVFVDRSPAGRRRWCDMRTCGNRAKVARHRARRRAGEAPIRPRSGARRS